ncbi:MAG: hypothetical protein AABP62_11170 [Planctomycetota bacterium]
MANPQNPQQQAIAKLLRVQAIPESRVNVFKTVIERNELRFLGWHQGIVDINRLDGVDHTTVLVHAIVTLKDGHPVRLLGATKEVYAMKNDKLVLVRTQTVGSATAMIVE